MGCFVVAEFLLTSASRGPSAIAEPLVMFCYGLRLSTSNEENDDDDDDDATVVQKHP